MREILAQFRTSRAIRSEPLEKISQLGSRPRAAIERCRYSARSGQGAFTAQANGVALPSQADFLAEQDMRLHPTLSGLSISDDVSRGQRSPGAHVGAEVPTAALASAST